LVVEPTASEEKLHELLREANESSALDYKATLDLSHSDEVVELVKDLAAMRAEPLGGYVVVGADDQGKPTDGLADARKAKFFDEATLRSKVQKYLTEPLNLMSGVHTVDGHTCAVVYIGPASRGFEVLRVEGVSGGKPLFRPGEVFVRRGTAAFGGTVRMRTIGSSASLRPDARSGVARCVRISARSRARGRPGNASPVARWARSRGSWTQRRSMPPRSSCYAPTTTSRCAGSCYALPARWPACDRRTETTMSPSSLTG
jgi:hypothetical protein